jgi:hypothetical protein
MMCYGRCRQLTRSAYPVTNPLIRNSALSNLKMLRSEEALGLLATKRTHPSLPRRPRFFPARPCGVLKEHASTTLEKSA